ncbi:MAG TPA: ABC transporter ATP-binding protein [Methanospirillum sp.]|uniref:ABC transporter ATP-binding protein n=1 Tax=Methanospirillum sp. TaxID=45200 RepID=UPI002B8BE044|nr:ABC transporter ATP-binding protein [Methanospirillum sp.]HWQ63020.1 ABC transporter ATP-binding protein [Methanospirillum sp.]
MIVNASSLLNVQDLSVTFFTNNKNIEICSKVSFSIRQNERVGLIGESGCGKTIVALSILRLLADSAKIEGRIIFEGLNLVDCSNRDLQRIRGTEISMVFEQPKTCLNPVYSIGWQISESVKKCMHLSGTVREEQVKDLLVSVGMDPDWHHQFPHQLSGGMQQRVMIAMAMASHPKLLITDEPTTALDLINQAQILDLIKEKIRTQNCSLLIITHDIDVASELCDTIMVMYAGEIVEICDIATFLKKPLHPYSHALISAMAGSDLKPIPGVVPEFGSLPCGCRFHPRCRVSTHICTTHPPLVKEVPSGFVRCHHA